MKNLMLRLRHWLIKKLGGYTEQKILPAARYTPMPSVRLNPERVVAQGVVNYDMLRDERDRNRYIADRMKQELTRKIVEEIMAMDFGVLTCEPDWKNGFEQIVYRMTLCVVPPNEWMKTSLGDCMVRHTHGERTDRYVI